MASIRQLRAFQAVLLSGTQTRAAEKLRLTQPAVSGLIDSLEAELGFQLFDRVRGRLIPTREASYFYEYASRALESLANLDHIAKEIRESNVGTLRIAAYPSISMGLLPRVVARFRRVHPDVGITLSTYPSPKVIDLLNQQQYDVGIAETPVAHEHTETERFRFRCICMVPPAHALAARDVIRPEDLAGESYIRVHGEHATSARLGELWAAADVQPRLEIDTQLYWAACVLAQEGCGLTLVDPLTAVEFSGRGLVAVRFEPSVFVEVGIIFPTSRAKSMPTLRFAQFLRDDLGRVAQQCRELLKSDPGPLLESGE